MPSSTSNRRGVEAVATLLVIQANPSYIHQSTTSTRAACTTSAVPEASRRTDVSWVSAKTKTRSKKSSRVVTPPELSNCGVAGTAGLLLGGVGRPEVVGVDDPVGVALLGQEALAVGGEVRVDGVAGDDRVEARRRGRRPSGAAPGRGAGPPPGGSRTCPTPGWRRSPRAGRWRSWRPWRRRAASISPVAERLEEPSRAPAPVVSPLMTGASSCSPSSSSWSRYWPMTRVGSPRCCATSCSTTGVLASRCRAGQPVALLGLGRGVRQPLARRAASTRTSTQSAGAM